MRTPRVCGGAVRPARQSQGARGRVARRTHDSARRPPAAAARPRARPPKREFSLCDVLHISHYN
eukprot:scaffold45534_cov77-Phaeocystis_antarctica.AAC.1